MTHKYKVGDKVLFAHFTKPSKIDKIRKDGCVHLEGDPYFVWANPNCIKPFIEVKMKETTLEELARKCKEPSKNKRFRRWKLREE